MTPFCRQRCSVTLQLPIFQYLVARVTDIKLNIHRCAGLFGCNQKGHDGLQRTGKATSETRCEQKVRLLFFCLSLCSPPVLGGLEHKREREKDNRVKFDGQTDSRTLFFSTRSSNNLLQNLFCVLCLTIRRLYLLWPAAGRIQPPAHLWPSDNDSKRTTNSILKGSSTVEGEETTFLWDWVEKTGPET